MYDVIIIGAGPAGLTAAIFTARRNLKTLVISKDLGGQAVLTDKIYNYPGIKFMAGVPLMQVFKEQADENGAEFLFEGVNGIKKVEEGFLVQTDQQEIKARSVILSFGLTPRDLDLPNEKELKGKSIFTETLSHEKELTNKNVAVIGGGNSALEACEYLSDKAEKIYLIHRRDAFRAEEVTVNAVKKLSNVEFILDSVVEKIHTNNNELSGLTLKNLKTDQESMLSCNAAIVKIGYRAYTAWLDDLVETDQRGHILTGKNCETKTEGLFAAGDCTDLPYKQIITSGGEGCKAAMQAYAHICKLEGKRPISIDWS